MTPLQNQHKVTDPSLALRGRSHAACRHTNSNTRIRGGTLGPPEPHQHLPRPRQLPFSLPPPPHRCVLPMGGLEERKSLRAGRTPPQRFAAERGALLKAEGGKKTRARNAARSTCSRPAAPPASHTPHKPRSAAGPSGPGVEAGGKRGAGWGTVRRWGAFCSTHPALPFGTGSAARSSAQRPRCPVRISPRSAAFLGSRESSFRRPLPFQLQRIGGRGGAAGARISRPNPAERLRGKTGTPPPKKNIN